MLTEKQAIQAEPAGTIEEKIEPLLRFLSNPWKLWENGSISLRRTILKLAFAERISYCRKQGPRTVKLSFPFKALEVFCGSEFRYGGAPQRELEPSETEQLLQELDDWADILKSEPEMVLALSAFSKAAVAEGSEPDGSPIPPPSAEPSP